MAQFLTRTNNNAIFGAPPNVLWGSEAPDGDAEPFVSAPTGTPYYRRVTANQTEIYVKGKEKRVDSDWRLVQGFICLDVSLGDFTDGGAAVGTYTSTEEIPIGAIVEYSTLNVLTVFNGSSTAVLTIGDGTDVDRYNTGTPSVKAATGHVTIGAPSGTTFHAAAKAVVLTVTEDSDFGDMTTGRMVVTVYYKR